MLKFNRRGDRVISVDVTDVPTKGITPTHWRVLTEDLNRELGGDWQVLKLSGRWLISDRAAEPGTRSSRCDTTSILRAIGLATGLAVVKRV